MHDLKLFVAPGTCARVPTIALEEIGVPFETELVRLAAKQQKTPEFLAKNPKGKVPTILIDGKPLTENVAILTWLHRTYPDAKLLPETTDELERVKQIADVAFFSATVHPIVTRIAMPMYFLDGEGAYDRIRPKGAEAMGPVMSMVNERLENGPWWYGENWSVVDGYLFWAWWRITGVGYSADQFPNIRDHAARSLERPSVARAMQREADNIEVLKSEGLYLAPK
ncbi:glutathione S-transferase family protein [Roseibium sp.]|uniref:glutathione S-transferase family protein n=1 Tax=Roseibium sp. TaxID=1936156 RepID=UPI003263E053